jgi:cyclopropane fatty-acyl-phospholipid synthase-like methyltransferase
MQDTPTLAEMPLYQHLDRVASGLAAQGIGPSDPIPMETLFGLDQWHYHGTEAVELAASRLQIGPTSHVLDIGSGIGGPARYLAYRYGCRVTAVELQPDLNAVAEDLTRRSGLAGLVTHVCDDAAAHRLPHASFTVAVSWLAILHMPDRRRLFGNVAPCLEVGGKVLIEDLCMRKPFAEPDLHDLRHVVYGITVTSVDAYVADLTSAGLTNVRVEDLTPDWAPFAARRLAAWRANRAEYVRVHGQAAYAGQELFYAVINRLYASGSLGGVRLIATRR